MKLLSHRAWNFQSKTGTFFFYSAGLFIITFLLYTSKATLQMRTVRNFLTQSRRLYTKCLSCAKETNAPLAAVCLRNGSVIALFGWNMSSFGVLVWVLFWVCLGLDRFSLKHCGSDLISMIKKVVSTVKSNIILSYICRKLLGQVWHGKRQNEN